MKTLTSSCAAVLVFATLSCAGRDAERPIVFDSKAFTDGGDAFVYAAGTLTGEGVQYKNNTVAVTCYKDRMECVTNEMDQIGPNQVSRLDSPTVYPVTKWNAYEVVAAASDVAGFGCRRTTISIVRQSRMVVWVEEPINQSASTCKNADTRLLKWTIEDPIWMAPRTR